MPVVHFECKVLGAISAPNGKPPPSALATTIASRDPITLGREEGASPSKAGLDLVEYQEDPVAASDLAQAGQERSCRSNVPAFAEYGLDEYSCDPAGRYLLLKQSR